MSCPASIPQDRFAMQDSTPLSLEPHSLTLHSLLSGASPSPTRPWAIKCVGLFELDGHRSQLDAQQRLFSTVWNNTLSDRSFLPETTHILYHHNPFLWVRKGKCGTGYIFDFCSLLSSLTAKTWPLCLCDLLSKALRGQSLSGGLWAPPSQGDRSCASLL